MIRLDDHAAAYAWAVRGDSIAGSAAEEAAQAAHVAEEQAGELSRAELIAATVDGIVAQLGAPGVLALHGELVAGQPVTTGGFVDELLTALERAYGSRRVAS